MVTAAIIINQSGKPAGQPGESRDDLDPGVLVTLTNADDTGVFSWIWEFISQPVGSSVTIVGSKTATFTPNVRGSYLIKLTVDGEISNSATNSKIAAVKTAFLGIRKPATTETIEFDKDDGWSAAQQAMIDAIDTDADLNLKRNGTKKPTADIDWDAYKIINLGGLENEGVLRFGETSDPSAVSDKGFLYAKDDSGDTELFYRDDSGNVVQITKDGQLDVESLQGNALPSTVANGFLKRDPANSGWEEVIYGSGSNTVCQGDDSRLSDSRAPTGAASGQLGGTYPGPDVRGVRETSGPTLLTFGVIPDGQVLMRDGSNVVGSVMSTGGKVKVSANDVIDGYLHEKLLTGSNMKFTIGNPGGSETLSLDAYGQPTKSIYVDGYRSDNYVADGSVFRPYKTITAALAAITDNSSLNRYELNVAAGTYNEQLTLKSYVSISGASRMSTIITYSLGHTIIAGVALSSGPCRLSSMSIMSTGDNPEIGDCGISGTSGANLELYDVYVESIHSDCVYADVVGTFTIGFSTLVSGDGNALYLYSGTVKLANAFMNGTNWDMYIDEWGLLYMDGSCQFYHGWWFLHEDCYFWLWSPARFIRNDSTVSGYSVSNALETLAAADGKVAIRADDTTVDHLHSKLLTGPGLKFSIDNPGGSETLTIDAYGEAKVSSADTTFDYLESKIVAGSNIAIVKMFPGSNEQLRISATGTGFDGYNVKVAATDTTPDFLQHKLVAGSNIELTQIGAGGNETLSVAITQVLKLDEQVSDPSPFANDGYLYSKDVGSRTELFYLDDSGQITQITSDGYLNPLGPAAGDLSGTYPSPTVARIQSRIVSPTAPLDGYTLVWNASAAQWSPQVQDGYRIQNRKVADIAPSDGYGLVWNDSLTQWEPHAVSDEKAKISAADTTTDYLESKIVAGSNITIVKLFAGGNEQLSIMASGTGFDGYNVKVTASDTTPDFLNNKLVAGPNITLAVLGGGGDETLQITGSPSNTLGQSYNQGGSGAGREIVILDGLPVQLTGDGYEALSTDGYLGLSEMLSDPLPLANKGLVYSKDITGRTELMYEDDASGIVQISKTGSVYVTKIQDRAVSAAVPTDSYGLIWNQGASEWQSGKPVSALHAISHKSGGYDFIRLDELAAPTNITTLNSTAGAHGLLPRLSGNSSDALRGDGTWGVVSSDGYNVKVSATDTTPDFLQQKLVAGLNIELTQVGAGGDETLSVSTTQVLKLDEQVSDPSPFANDGYLYSKDVGSRTELFYLDDSGQITQITSDGYLDTLESLRGVGMFAQGVDPTYAVDKGILYTKNTDGVTELFYRDNYGDIIQVSKAGRFDLPDGYISFRYDEMGPTGTTGTETLLTLGAVPVDGYALHVFRNGLLMRPVDALGGSDKQEFTQSGDQVEFVASGQIGDWYSAFYIDGYMLTGAGGSVKQNVAMANNQSTDSDSDTVVGVFPIAAGDYPSRTVKFLVTAFVTNEDLTGYVKLYNITDDVLVESFSFTGVTTTKQISSAINLPTSEKMYEIRISVTGGADPIDRVVCMWAGLQIG
jgi:hypothetical protein